MLHAMNVYGIKSCDSCRKARAWLEEQGIDHRWRDLREDGLDRAKIAAWLAALGPEGLVNRRSTTWRALTEAEREAALDPARSADLLLARPTLIKRPVFELEDRVLVGFNAAVREQL